MSAAAYRTRASLRRRASAEHIQAWWGRVRGRLRRLRRQDPITLMPLGPPVFVHISQRPPHTETVFSPRVLAAYLEDAGDFRDPMTREPLSSVDVLRLQHLARAKGRTETRVHDDMRALEARRAEREQEDTLVSFISDEVISVAGEIRDLVRRPGMSLADVISDLQTNLFPTFSVGCMRVHTVRQSELPPLMARVQRIVEGEGAPEGAVAHPIAQMVSRSFLRTTLEQIRSQSADEFESFDQTFRRGRTQSRPLVSPDRRITWLRILRARVLSTVREEGEWAVTEAGSNADSGEDFDEEDPRGEEGESENLE